MALIARKINRAKWKSELIEDFKDLWADPVTSCLRTKNNTLSVWSIDNKADLNEAVLAIACGFKHLDSIDVVLVEISQLDKAGIEYKNTEGITAIEELKETHIDLVELNFLRLGDFAKLVQESIVNDDCYRITKGTLKSLLSEAVDKGRLVKDELNKSVADKL